RPCRDARRLLRGGTVRLRALLAAHRSRREMRVRSAGRRTNNSAAATHSRLTAPAPGSLPAALHELPLTVALVSPVAPMAPVAPAAPVAPVAPAGPVAPVDPIAPVDPGAPVAPVAPAAPAAPVAPVPPVAPVGPVGPTAKPTTPTSSPLVAPVNPPLD